MLELAVAIAGLRTTTTTVVHRVGRQDSPGMLSMLRYPSPDQQDESATNISFTALD